MTKVVAPLLLLASSSFAAAAAVFGGGGEAAAAGFVVPPPPPPPRGTSSSSTLATTTTAAGGRRRRRIASSTSLFRRMEGAEEDGGMKKKTTTTTKKTTKTTATARGGSASSSLADINDPMVSTASASAVELDDDDDYDDVAVELDDEYDVDDDDGLDDESRVRRRRDGTMMAEAVSMVRSMPGGERAPRGPYPGPVCGALLVAEDGRVLGRGLSDYARHAVEHALLDAGVGFAPLNEWFVVDWSSDSDFRRDVGASTMYVTLEPSDERRGEERPPITQLIEMANIPRIVIGCQDPVPEYAARGAGSLHASGVSVTMGVMREECERLISGYATLANSKIHRMARRHMQRFGRPMGHLHCSVIDSDDAEAFIRNGNSFGKNFGGKILSYRDFGAYEIAPPPESIWASGEGSGVDDVFEPDVDDYFFNNMDFEDEDAQENLGKNPMMPWYEQVDACVATFPKSGNGPVDDNSIQGRLTGLKWLATDGKSLPAGVERILVMDATDLQDLPLSNDDPNLPVGVDVEEFWKADGRKPSRILLRHGDNAVAIAVAKAAAKAAAAAAEAAAKAKAAIETGDAELAAEAALECQEAAMASNKFIQNELQKTQDLKKRLVKLGVKVEIIKGGGNPVDVMEHLGKRSGYNSVVWRAGCWGNRGVEAILAGAFQRISAHLAVDAIGGKYWQLMLAERALQSACGPERQIKVFAEQDDINLEYCDREGADKDCALLFDGRPVRHVRLDARVAVIDEIKGKEQTLAKTVSMKKFQKEEAPWFL